MPRSSASSRWAWKCAGREAAIRRGLGRGPRHARRGLRRARRAAPKRLPALDYGTAVGRRGRGLPGRGQRRRAARARPAAHRDRRRQRGARRRAQRAPRRPRGHDSRAGAARADARAARGGRGGAGGRHHARRRRDARGAQEAGGAACASSARACASSRARGAASSPWCRSKAAPSSWRPRRSSRSIGQDPDLRRRWRSYPRRCAARRRCAQASGVEGVWAGGDVASMARFVTDAIGQGKRAAFDIDRRCARAGEPDARRGRRAPARQRARYRATGGDHTVLPPEASRAADRRLDAARAWRAAPRCSSVSGSRRRWPRRCAASPAAPASAATTASSSAPTSPSGAPATATRCWATTARAAGCA